MGNISKWSLSTTEIGKSVGENSGKTYKVYIAKILPLIKFGQPKSKLAVISKNCFINASTCKISLASKIKSVNYILVSTANASKLPESVSHGTKLRISSINKNVDKLNVASKQDKSL